MCRQLITQKFINWLQFNFTKKINLVNAPYNFSKYIIKKCIIRVTFFLGIESHVCYPSYTQNINKYLIDNHNSPLRNTKIIFILK
jgi:hypothetical protein